MKYSLNFLKPLFTLSLLVLFMIPLPAAIIQVKAARYSIDLPEGWEILDAKDPARTSYISADGTAALKILVYNGGKYADAPSFYNAIAKELKAAGDNVKFFFGEMDAVLADLTFSTGNFDARGYAVLLNRDDYDYALLAYSPVDSYEANHDYLLSALDSFSLDQTGRLYPGPVSIFLVQAAPEEMITCQLTIDNQDYTFELSMNQLETSRDIINREARILAGFKAVNINAWQRFYRMIYRDNYLSLNIIYKLVNRKLAALDKKSKIKKTLEWIQGFTYTRTGDVADFTSPLDAAVTASGDCDSRVILYITLLHYMQIDAVLLVSSAYSHSAAGINQDEYPAAGASIKQGNRQYLYTELTDTVEIGLIPAEMADIAQWTVFQLK